VFEQTSVKSLGFSATESSRPVTAEWLRASDGETGVISFDYLVDASGRLGLMSTKYLRNRHFNASLKNIALWGYWTGVGTYGVNTAREGAPWFETLRGTHCIVNGECVNWVNRHQTNQAGPGLFLYTTEQLPLASL